MREREREGEVERERERERDRQTDRQRDSERETQTETQTERQTDRENPLAVLVFKNGSFCHKSGTEVSCPSRRRCETFQPVAAEIK